jgi:branched-chain amino acid transport system substrate-binding protein
LKVGSKDCILFEKSCLEKLKNLAAKGVRIVIGPATSADVQEVEDYADKNGILIISPSSTAHC